MAQLDFPASPITNQVFNAPNGAAYQWDGTVWKVATDTGSPIVISATPPASPVVGQQWWRNDPDGSMFLYYDDGNSKQWVPAVSYTGGPVGPAGGSLAGTYPNPTSSILTVQTRVRRSTSQPTTTGVDTVLTFDTAATNVGGAYSAGTPDRLIAPTAGFYLAGGHFQFEDGAGAGNQRCLYLKSQSAGIFGGIAMKPTAWCFATATAGIALGAGEYVQITALQDSGGTLNVGACTFWLVRVA